MPLELLEHHLLGSPNSLRRLPIDLTPSTFTGLYGGFIKVYTIAVGMEPTLAAYLAGAMDSDGYFSIKKSTYGKRHGLQRAPGYYPLVGIKQITAAIPDIMLEHFRGYRFTQKPSTPNGKPLEGWQGTNQIAVRLISVVRPYLKIKGEQADLLLKLNVIRHRGKDGVFVGKQMGRWGKEMTVRRPVYSEDTVAEMDGIYWSVRGLNDTRLCFQTIG